jgi:hypothetical protein
MIKRSIPALLLLLAAFGVASARAQVVPAATRGQFELDAGGLFSVFQPDYAGFGIAQTSPNRLYGIGAYVDIKVTRWVQFEVEGRWNRFNPYLGITEDNYLAGYKLPIHHFGRFTPYGKAMIGMGSGTFLNGNATTYAFGGGVDYRLTRKLSIRACDFEFQQWRVNPTLMPYGGSVGIAYRVF